MKQTKRSLYHQQTSALVLSMLMSGPGALRGQASTSSPDPYRNFVGSWSGTIPIHAEKIPDKVKLVVTEEADRTAMRWDYVFGVTGEKGYAHDTRWIILQPAQSRMLMHRRHSSEVVYKTTGLYSFNRVGFGSFTGEVVFGKDAVFDKVTLSLQPNSLSYQWETSRDGTNYFIYLKSVLKRDGVPGISRDATSNKE